MIIFATMSNKDFSFGQVTFAKTHNEEFYKTLRKRVLDHFKSSGKSRHANANMVFKTITMCALYFVPFAFLFVVESTWISMLLWITMGVGMAGCGLSVMHDANHGAYSKRQWINKYLGHIIIFLGGNDTTWRIQHNVLHHTYTNVAGLDEDLDPGPVLRFSPHEDRLPQHKYQHIYAWFLYGLMTMMWMTVKDFKQVYRYKKMDLLSSQGKTYKKTMWFVGVTKAVYIFMFMVSPMIWGATAWYVALIGFLVMQFLTGFILSIIFQPAHVVPTSNYSKPDESGNIDADWAVNQLFNTTNFAPKARLFSWYVGGLNYQVEHHLFPNICHIHYRKLSKIVRETAIEYDLPYNSFNTFRKALVEHGKMLYNLGHQDDAAAIH
jgi:linoleoyl-CoA desaturase